MSRLTQPTSHHVTLPPEPLQAKRRSALRLGTLVALYGNSFAVLDSITQLSLGGTVGGAALGVGAVSLAARSGRAELAGLGLGRRGLGKSLLDGLLLGLLLGLPGVVYLAWRELAPTPIRFAALAETSFPAFVALVFGRLLFFTALAEELAFRGLLQSRLRSAFGPARAILIGAVVFAAWHLVVSLTTLRGTNLASDLGTAGLAYVVQNLAVLCAGLLWGLLRERSGNLAGCILSHWLADALLVAGLYFG